MKMQKYIYRCGTAICLFALAACSSEQFNEIDLTPGDTPIVLSGTTTRETGSTNTSLEGYTNLKLSSKIDRGASGIEYVDYFKNVGLTATTEGSANKSKLSAANAYYPLKGKELRLFGHTNPTNSAGAIDLTSGKATNATDLQFDYLISNGTDGKGTPSSSKDGTSETLLTFRHVMTKLEVAIDVSNTDLQQTKPENIQIRFKDGYISKRGTYNITTARDNDDKVTSATIETGADNYELSVGTHYLVPNGKTLSGTGTDGKGLLSYLKIDDYIATTADLEAIEIPKTILNGTEIGDLTLKPGLAYKLTFIIKRLKVEGITLTVEDWKPNTDAKPEWGCDPYKMTLTVNGGYDASEEDNKITRLVLHHTADGKDYQYVGEGTYNSDDKNTYIKFLSIPKTLDASSNLTIDAYTKYGLLIEGQKVTYTKSDANKGDISLSLSANGMVADKNVYLISTPLQFYNFLNNPLDNTSYRIAKNIDMDALKGMPVLIAKEFPSGSTLEGGTYPDTNDGSLIRTNSILHLNRAGGLFSTNKGTLKNIYIFSGTITAGSGTHMGSICDVNEGTIEGCVNEADLVPSESQTAGGICGKNNGTILACLNTGNIQTGATVGGICGENTKDAADIIKACVNTGMLNKSATNLGGICGTTTATSNKIINTCYWLTGTARKEQDINNERAVGSDATNATCENASDLAPERLRKDDIINGLSTAASSWKFELKPKICAWPIPIAVTAP